VPLDPQAQAIVDALNAVEDPPMTVEAQRAGFAMLLALAGPPEPVVSVETRDADGVPVGIYRPSDDPNLPVVMYFHGGGWTIGTVAEFDPVLRQVANATQAIVVSPDYRLAPEHPFPAPLDDCWTALNWVAKNAAQFGGDATRLAVMGDSAGGNISAVCALRARDAGFPDLAMQVLVYPVTDHDFTTPSYRENGEGFLLTEARMRWFFDCYTAGGGIGADDWRISPLRAPDVSGVAPAFVITAGYDPLRDEGEAYARRLAAAGVRATSYRYDGMIHGFFGLSGAFDASRDALGRVGTELRRVFGTLNT
jgi:acetyl esterase